MLPAISADLPALLVPPSNKEAGQTTNTDNGFGPSARVEVSTDRAIQTQSQQPDSGIYGPDGRFVESAARRTTTQPRRESNSTASRQETDPQPRRRTNTRDPESQTARTNGSDMRDLTLAEFDAAVPPAAREELRALADRVDRKTTTQSLSPKDFKRLSQLFDQVGRFGKAKEALDRARDLETQNETPQEDARESGE